MRVGVILAARAPVPHLGEALASVLSQDPAPDEVVVVDHGSSPPLRVPEGARLVRLGCAGGGPAAARHAGLEALDTELVALVDADDVWEPGKLAAQLGALAAYPDAAVCFGVAQVVDGAGRATGESLPAVEAGVYAGRAMTSLLYERNVIPASSVVMRRHALDAVGGFVPDEPLPAATDYDLWLRLAAAGHAFVCEPAARIRYRRHSGGLTSDVALLGEAGLLVHRRHEGLVGRELARRVQARDLQTLARGRIRQRRYSEARAALSQAAALHPPAPRERALRVVAALPGLRALLGRRDPYRQAS